MDETTIGATEKTGFELNLISAFSFNANAVNASNTPAVADQGGEK